MLSIQHLSPSWTWYTVRISCLTWGLNTQCKSFCLSSFPLCLNSYVFILIIFFHWIKVSKTIQREGQKNSIVTRDSRAQCELICEGRFQKIPAAVEAASKKTPTSPVDKNDLSLASASAIPCTLAVCFRIHVSLKSLPASLLCHSNFHGKNCYPSICELLEYFRIRHKHIRV